MPRNSRRLSAPTVRFPLLLTRDEIAEICEVHPGTVSRWAAESNISVLRFGGVMRFYAAEALDYLTIGMTSAERETFLAGDDMNAEDDVPALLTPADIARLLAVSRKTVQRLIAAGEVPRQGSPRACKVPAASVVAWIDANTTPARHPFNSRRRHAWR